MSRDAWARYTPGANWRYSVDVDGLKANMTDVQAAVGRAQLRHFPRWQIRREEIARRYAQGLAAVDGLALPAWPERGRHAWHLYVVRVEPHFGIGRDELIGHLSDAGVDCSVHFIPLHQLSQFARAAGSSELPGADTAAEQIVSLPMYPSLTDDEVDRVCEAIDGLRRRPLRSPRHSTHSRVEVA
jgi:perosamine synthetase